MWCIYGLSTTLSEGQFEDKIYVGIHQKDVYYTFKVLHDPYDPSINKSSCDIQLISKPNLNLEEYYSIQKDKSEDLANAIFVDIGYDGYQFRNYQLNQFINDVVVKKINDPSLKKEFYTSR